MTYIDKLEKMGACPDAIEMLRKAKHSTLQKAWDAWKRSDHMLWLMIQARSKEPACPECERNARLFACDCAERALERERKAGREPDKRSWEAIRIARLYADGKATAEELDAAWDAAGDAARDAAGDAAWSAAWSAAWDAARDSACDAVCNAARDAARDAERAWQARRLRRYFPSSPRIG